MSNITIRMVLGLEDEVRFDDCGYLKAKHEAKLPPRKFQTFEGFCPHNLALKNFSKGRTF